MKNFVQSGNTITATAPGGGVTSGDGLVIGSLFGIASGDAAEGADVELVMTGVFDLPKKAGDTVTAGAKIYWDESDSEATITSGSDAMLIGAAIAAAGGGAATVRTRLNGASV